MIGFRPSLAVRWFARGCLLPALVVGASARAADVPAVLRGTCVDVVPADAAFLSATLRGREQLELFLKSNAWKALRALPGVARALDSLEEQRTMPGSPLAVVDTFLQLPENAEAVAVLSDMVATDTFVYGEPSCVAFVKLVKKLQQAQQAAGIMAAGDLGGDDIIIEEEMLEEEGFDGDAAALERPGPRVRPVRLRQVDVEALSPDAIQKRMLVQALADNLDLVVFPDVVWGFKVSKPDAARTQLKRVEVLAKLVEQADPELAGAVKLRDVAGGKAVVLTLDGARLPWDDIQAELEQDAGDIDGFEQVFEKLRGIDLVVAVGVVGDWVVLSVGDALDHLEKLALPGRDREGLAATAPFAPLREAADSRFTGINYLSAPLAAELTQSRADVEEMTKTLAALAEESLSEEAAEDVREWLGKGAKDVGGRMPEPGPWLAFSFLTDRGYEGYVWNWAKNQPFDGTKRLDLLDHAGGAPLAVVVSRLRSDPRLVDDVVAFVKGGWSLFEKHGLPTIDDDERAEAEEAAGLFGGLGGKFADVLRDKLLPAIADGQVGLVVDAKTRVKRLQEDLPASVDPLPVAEPAIVLPLRDPKLFREGLSDLFALSDELVAGMRRIDPDSVPPDYRIPDPEKAKVEAGSVWSFALPNAGLDEQLRPAIGVGEKVAVFSLVPKQAERLLAPSALETGSQLAEFEEPLAAAAALDVAGIVDALKPWAVYVARFASVQQQDGNVEADRELSAADENEQAKDALEHVDVVLEVVKCLRAAVAETATRDDATVTHWRNVIRDLPAK